MPKWRGAAGVVAVAGLTAASFVGAMLAASGVHVGARTAAALFYGGMVVAAAGFVTLRTTVDDAWQSIGLTLVVGSCVTSLAITAGCLITGRTAAVVLAAFSGAVAPLCAVALTRSPKGRLEIRDAVCIACLAILVMFWCHRTFGLVDTIRTTHALPFWSDYFIHATEIAQFGDRRSIPHSAFLLANQPVVFYHYASYMLPAAVAAIVNTPSVVLACSVLLPYGILMAALGAYSFVRTLAGDWIAVTSAAALLLVPDASKVGLHNGFFGFHWLLFTAPGSGYGIGMAFTALALAALWKRSNASSCLWLAAFLTAGLFEFRAQIFLLFAPALAGALLWEFSPAVRRLCPAVLVVSAIAIVLILFAVPGVRAALVKFSAFQTFLVVSHTGQTPTAYDGFYQTIVQQYGQVAASVVGLFLLIPAALGALVLGMPLARLTARRHAPPDPLDSFPLWCLAAWVALVLIVPQAPHGDFTEYQHRPFVWLYAVWLVWAFLYAGRALRSTAVSKWVRVLALAVTVVLLSGGALMTWRTDLARPSFDWGRQNFGRILEPGLWEASLFVRSQAEPGDVFALLPTDRWNLLDDPATRFASLANVPAYLARPAIQALHGDQRRAVVERRVSDLDRIETAQNSGSALQTLKQLRVRYLVTVGPDEPRFDREHASVAFRSGLYSVYQVDRTAR